MCVCVCVCVCVFVCVCVCVCMCVCVMYVCIKGIIEIVKLAMFFITCIIHGGTLAQLGL